MLTHDGTNGRAYGGDANLVHIPDHHRADVGAAMADSLERTMRLLAIPLHPDDWKTATLCPGCYMIAGFDMLVELARRTGQPVKEIAATMARAFTELASDADYRMTEEMTVVAQ